MRLPHLNVSFLRKHLDYEHFRGECNININDPQTLVRGAEGSKHAPPPPSLCPCHHNFQHCIIPLCQSSRWTPGVFGKLQS